MSFIATALGFVHNNKWAMDVVIIAVLAGGAWGAYEHAKGAGRQEQRDVDALELEKQRLVSQAKADEASHAHETEVAGLRQYVADHPLHGGLCINYPSLQAPRTAVGGDAGASTGAGDIQPVSSGSSGAGGQQGPDVRHLLDVLALNADGTSASLRREYKAR